MKFYILYIINFINKFYILNFIYLFYIEIIWYFSLKHFFLKHIFFLIKSKIFNNFFDILIYFFFIYCDI